VKSILWLALALALFFPVPRSLASGLKRPFELNRLNRRLHGHVVDHTNRHLGDHRIWSEALQEPRDLYVYLPPGYDPHKCYPLILWLHGIGSDEQAFLKYAVEDLDLAMACGKLPPAIVAAPDGSLRGFACFTTIAGSFFLNTKAGRFEDFLMQDVWNFLHQHYPIRPEPEAHVLAGVSMGGGSAFNLAIKYRERCRVVFGLFPPLNLRWVDCHSNYQGDFDPCCWGWRTDMNRPNEVIGRFGIFVVRLQRILAPLFGRRNPQTVEELSRENPIEMIDRLNLKEGELQMYVAYGARDQFNIDAQVESFLYLARQRGLTVGVGYDPRGRHDYTTAERLLPGVIHWLAPRLAPFSP
jgi:S-formylglutathione hydrolase FrmB